MNNLTWLLLINIIMILIFLFLLFIGIKYKFYVNNYNKNYSFLIIIIIMGLLSIGLVWSSLITYNDYNSICKKFFDGKLLDYDKLDMIYPIGISCSNTWFNVIYICNEPKKDIFGNPIGKGEYYISSTNNRCSNDLFRTIEIESININGSINVN